MKVMEVRVLMWEASKSVRMPDLRDGDDLASMTEVLSDGNSRILMFGFRGGEAVLLRTVGDVVGIEHDIKRLVMPDALELVKGGFEEGSYDFIHRNGMQCSLELKVVEV